MFRPSQARAEVTTIAAFFETLYPDADNGWLILSHPDPMRLNPHGKALLRSLWFDLSTASLAQIAQASARLSQQYNLYFGVALQHPDTMPSALTRGKHRSAYAIPGLWFDLDLAYGHHAASTLPATDAEALNFLGSLPAPPSVILHSGGGLYGWWLFKEPSLIATETERDTIAHLSRQFTHTLVEAGKHHGWTLDALGDLARVLRPPGTINHKYDTQVETIHESGVRYNLCDFDWLVDLPTPAKALHLGSVITGQPDLVAIAEHYGTGFTEKSQTELAGAHPQHGSSTGDNFCVNPEKGLWHCWRHGTGGDALTLIAVCEGLLACEEAHSGALHGERFRQVVQIVNTTFHGGIWLHGEGGRVERRRSLRDPVVPWYTPVPAPIPPMPMIDVQEVPAWTI